MKGSYLNDGFFSRLETLALNLRTSLLGYFGGKHLVKTYGQTVEFADYREYMLGDDIRRIDWNLYSRFEKYFLKLFTDERQMHIQIFLDCSDSMGRFNPDKKNYAVAAAAAMGFLAVHNMDKVSFNFMKEDRADNPYGTIVGKNAFFRAVGDFEQIELVNSVDIDSCVLNSPETTDKNGLTVIISDFLVHDNWKKAVDYLCYKQRQVLLLQVLSPDEIDPAYDGRYHLVDSEIEDITDERNIKLRINKSALQAYRMAYEHFIDNISSYCKKRDVGFITVSSGTPIERVLFGELLKAGVMA